MPSPCAAGIDPGKANAWEQRKAEAGRCAMESGTAKARKYRERAKQIQIFAVIVASHVLCNRPCGMSRAITTNWRRTLSLCSKLALQPMVELRRPLIQDVIDAKEGASRILPIRH